MPSNAPAITGFEVPASTAGVPQGDQVIVALLDQAPNAAWLQCLSKRADAFKRIHAIRDLRAVGRNLVCVGTALNVRAMTHALRGLVDTVAIDLRSTRMSAAPAAASDQPATQWIDGGLAEVFPDAPDMLRAINTLTGMRFAAMSRVDRKHWTALAFYDAMAFGMAPSQQLDLEATICGDAMASRQTVAFGKAASDPTYACSTLPSLYGFESYISVPILLPDGEVFGTVCALDAEPRELTPEILEQMQAYARQVAEVMSRLRPHEAPVD
ncbi:MAG: GAF domain-containing protein [Pseudoxanthomonas sp.]|jgi:GAF domain-containing protein